MMGSNTLVPPRIGVGEQIAHTLKIFVDVLVFTLPWLLQRLAISPTYLAEAGGFYVAMGSSVAVLAALDASTCQANTTDRMRRTFASSLTVHPTSIIPHDSTSRQPHGSTKVLYHSPAGMGCFKGFDCHNGRPFSYKRFDQRPEPRSAAPWWSPLASPQSGWNVWWGSVVVMASPLFMHESGTQPTTLPVAIQTDHLSAATKADSVSAATKGWYSVYYQQNLFGIYQIPILILKF